MRHNSQDSLLVLINGKSQFKQSSNAFFISEFIFFFNNLLLLGEQVEQMQILSVDLYIPTLLQK
jgi:hypothetical protein